MKIILLITISLILALPSNAQKRKANKDTENWRYELEGIQQGVTGNQRVVPTPEPTLGGIGSRGPRPQGIPQGEA